MAYEIRRVLMPGSEVGDSERSSNLRKRVQEFDVRSRVSQGSMQIWNVGGAYRERNKGLWAIFEAIILVRHRDNVFKIPECCRIFI